MDILLMSKQCIIPVHSLVNTQSVLGEEVVNFTLVLKNVPIYFGGHAIQKDSVGQLSKSTKEAFYPSKPRQKSQVWGLRNGSLHVAMKPHGTMNDYEQKNQGFGKC